MYLFLLSDFFSSFLFFLFSFFSSLGFSLKSRPYLFPATLSMTIRRKLLFGFLLIIPASYVFFSPSFRFLYPSSLPDPALNLSTFDHEGALFLPFTFPFGGVLPSTSLNLQGHFNKTLHIELFFLKEIFSILIPVKDQIVLKRLALGQRVARTSHQPFPAVLEELRAVQVLFQDQGLQLELHLEEQTKQLKIPFRVPYKEAVGLKLVCSEIGCIEEGRIEIRNIPMDPLPPATPSLPPILAKDRSLPRYELFIGILSHPFNRGKRNSLRFALRGDLAVRKNQVGIRFFVGRSDNQKVNWMVEKEAERFQDIELLPMKESYLDILHKVVAIFTYGTSKLEAPFLMKTDDDSFYRPRSVLMSLANHPRKWAYIGSLIHGAAPFRNPSHRWYIPEDEYEGETLPDYMAGHAYILSSDLALFLRKEWEKGNLPFFRMEDVAVGMWVRKVMEENHIRVNLINHFKFSVSYFFSHPASEIEIVSRSGRNRLSDSSSPDILGDYWIVFVCLLLGVLVCMVLLAVVASHLA